MILVLCTSPNAFIFVPSHVKISQIFQNYWTDTISIVIFSMGHNSIKMKVKLRFLFSAHFLITLYICTNFVKYLKRFQSF